MNGGIKEYEEILQTYYNTNDNQEKKYALNSLGAINDVALKKRTLDWTTKSGDVKLQDFFYPYGTVSSRFAWNYYKEVSFIEFMKCL